MNQHLTSLYAAIVDSHIVCVSTNLADFVKKFNIVEKLNTTSYITFSRSFKKDTYFTQTIAGKEYHFQKVI